MALERYALARYGEEIPASTFRSYKKRKGLKSEVQRFGEIVDPERMVDVMGLRSEIIQLQVERIKIDAQHERDMRKLFGTTRGEIGLLNQLLSEHKLDLQDLGLFPKAGEALMITHGTPEADEVNAPKHVSLAAALGVDADGEAELAQVLHMQLKNAESG